MAGAPDELSTSVSLGVDPAGGPTASIGVCWCGDHDEGIAALRNLTDTAVETLLAVASAVPPGVSGIGRQGLRGAASRVPVEATAFPHRAEQYDFLILAQWADPAESTRHIAWARESFAAMRPHLEDAVYVNNLGNEDGDRVRAAYGPNHQRLAELKRRYDVAP